MSSHKPGFKPLRRREVRRLGAVDPMQARGQRALDSRIRRRRSTQRVQVRGQEETALLRASSGERGNAIQRRLQPLRWTGVRPNCATWRLLQKTRVT